MANNNPCPVKDDAHVNHVNHFHHHQPFPHQVYGIRWRLANEIEHADWLLIQYALILETTCSVRRKLKFDELNAYLNTPMSRYMFDNKTFHGPMNIIHQGRVQIDRTMLTKEETFIMDDTYRYIQLCRYRAAPNICLVDENKKPIKSLLYNVFTQVLQNTMKK